MARSGTQFFTTEEIRHFAARSDVMGALLVIHCWVVIAAAFTLFIWLPNPLTFILALMIVGSRQLGLAILMHDAAHNALFKSPKLNEFVGSWLCGYPVLADLPAYRTYHLKHHRHTQTEEDPDLVLSRPFPTTRASMVRKIVRDLTGLTGLKLRFQQFVLWMQMAGDDDAVEESARRSQSFSDPKLGPALIVNGLIFSGLAFAGYWWAYPLLWVLPLLTWYQLVVRMRNIAEHGVVEFSDNPLRNVRTTRAGPFMRLFLAPYWVNYHLEHHLVMHVPCWNLKKMHSLMLEKGHRADMEIGVSYWDVLRRASARPI